jgi:hypothetical protein
MHENDAGVSPIESTMIMFEEMLQSLDGSDCFRLSLILTSKNDSIRVNATPIPSGFSHPIQVARIQRILF